ncbi:hypothetical protein HPB49_011092 [Dermacentor silvarum]|uniref:Uncharacterized protein n=1 Tax=Dermacentor silvarum TaxID=543639 RepID=A0ACB8DZU6_DERSI|nr:hypothetical protein HPB49_011092 [Dermacentor silvarum]
MGPAPGARERRSKWPRARRSAVRETGQAPVSASVSATREALGRPWHMRSTRRWSPSMHRHRCGRRLHSGSAYRTLDSATAPYMPTANEGGGGGAAVTTREERAHRALNLEHGSAKPLHGGEPCQAMVDGEPEVAHHQPLGKRNTVDDHAASVASGSSAWVDHDGLRLCRRQAQANSPQEVADRIRRRLELQTHLCHRCRRATDEERHVVRVDHERLEHLLLHCPAFGVESGELRDCYRRCGLPANSLNCLLFPDAHSSLVKRVLSALLDFCSATNLRARL